MEQRISVRRTPIAAMYRLFSAYRGSGSVFKTPAEFASERRVGLRSGGIEKIGPRVFNDTSSVHRNGNAVKTASAARMRYSTNLRVMAGCCHCERREAICSRLRLLRRFAPRNDGCSLHSLPSVPFESSTAEDAEIDRRQHQKNRGQHQGQGRRIAQV